MKMLITFKTLEQKMFKIEIDENLRVSHLKEKIAEEKGNELYPVAGQKLIYAGKILDDEKLIADYKIDPVKNFVVVMAVKPKVKVEKSKEGESSSSSLESTQSSEASREESSQAPTSIAASQTISEISATAESDTMESLPTESQNTSLAGDSDLLTGAALESAITELMSFGYSREQVMRALNRSFHNADRAAEYLLSGNIPDNPEEDDDPPAVGASPAGGTPEAGDLSFLRDLPQFQLMRSQVQADRNRLPDLLQEIGRANPQLLSIISQNQEAFIALLNEPIPSDDGGASGGAGAGAVQIQVTPSEKQAIDRMVSMGFQQEEVIQVFFACDKNEQLAIEFLLNN